MPTFDTPEDVLQVLVCKMVDSPKRQISDSSKLKKFADDNSELDEYS